MSQDDRENREIKVAKNFVFGITLLFALISLFISFNLAFSADILTFPFNLIFLILPILAVVVYPVTVKTAVLIFDVAFEWSLEEVSLTKADRIMIASMWVLTLPLALFYFFLKGIINRVFKK